MLGGRIAKDCLARSVVGQDDHQAARRPFRHSGCLVEQSIKIETSRGEEAKKKKRRET